MLTEKQVLALGEFVEQNRKFIEHNQILFDITEGDLLTYLTKTLEAQFTGDSAKIALERAIPINILKRIVSKLSKLYMTSPTRKTENPTNQELIDYYVKEQDVDTYFNDANENFNTYKNCVLELFEDKNLLNTRAIPSNGFLPFTFNEVDKTSAEGIIKFLLMPGGKKKMWIHTDEEFLAVDDTGKIVREDMSENDGNNPFKVLPFAYMSRSRYLLIPKADSDLLRMTLVIPVLLTDLTFSSMFMSNPIVYTIDANVDNMKMGPNICWNMKSDEPDKKPEVGVVKPDPNLEAQLNMIKDILALWLQTKNIKATNIGSMSVENIASGIALLIQEMDTTEDRQAQTVYFKALEKDYWRKLAIMHNELVIAGRIKEKRLFSNPEELIVDVTYGSMKIIETKAEVVERVTKELAQGLTTKARAIKELNPVMSTEDIVTLMKEIDAEKPKLVIETTFPEKDKEEADE